MMKKFLSSFLIIVLFLMINFNSNIYAQEKKCFQSGLHYTGKGMQYWYEAKDGFMATYKPKEKPLIQLGLYAEPFTQDDLNKLKIKQKYEN